MWDYDDTYTKISELQEKWNINKIFDIIKKDIWDKFDASTDSKLSTSISNWILDNIKRNWFRIIRN